MIELGTLGALWLLGDGTRDFDAVLSQPKRLVLLVYLAVEHHGGFARRDTLVGLFWPDRDDEHARGSLRQSLAFLRRALGDDVFVRCGAESIGIDADHLETDAVLFERACDSGNADEALQRYAGDLLEGVFVSDVSPDLERWVEDERARLRRRAAQAAWELVARCEHRGDFELAVEHARRAVALAPHDERGLRRLIALLDRTTDYGGAVQAYETFSRRLADDIDVAPSSETTALMTRVRTRIGFLPSIDMRPGRQAGSYMPPEPMPLGDAPPPPHVAPVQRWWPVSAMLASVAAAARRVGIGSPGEDD